MATTLEDDLIAAGETFALENDHQCEHCGKWFPAFGLTNVEANDYWPHASYACGHCIMNYGNHMNAIFGPLLRAMVTPTLPSPSVILAEKRRILNETLWATANDGTVTPEEATAWLQYRQEVAAVDPNNFTGWPTPPEN